VKVIIPPPEVIFRTAPGCRTPAVGAQAQCAPPAPLPSAAPPAAPPAAAPAYRTVTQTHLVPYLTYQWTPVVTPSASFAGAGFSSAAVGSSFAGFGAGAVPGLPVGLSGVPLAPPAAFAPINLASPPAWAPPPASPPAAALPGLEALLIRALIGKIATTALSKSGCDSADTTSAAKETEAQQSTLKAAIVGLNTKINALNEKLDAEITKLREEMTTTDEDIARTLATETGKLRKEIDSLDARLKIIEKNPKLKEGADK
jgi:hypothetical protein